MEAIRIQKVMKKDGELSLSGLPFRKGEAVELILLARPKKKRRKKGVTAAQLLKSDWIGMWKDRQDIGDSVEFARTLRKRASTRSE
ncbi:MAG: hypothetical protein HY741_25000 [Chloroflexi bacterium]|nr:hypothetical protein [Chloroflexota bacterium]